MKFLRRTNDTFSILVEEVSDQNGGNTRIYRNIKCYTDNKDQLVGLFSQYPDALTLRELFLRFIANYSTFHCFGEDNGNNFEWITYQEFAESVIGFACALRNLGISTGERVGVLIESSTWFALSQWALAYFGATMVVIPLHETLIAKIKEMQRVGDLGVNHLICSDKTYTKVGLLGVNYKFKNVIVTCDKETEQTDIRSVLCSIAERVSFLPEMIESHRKGETIECNDLKSEATAVISFSSRDGDMKPVSVTHGNCIAAAAAISSSSGYHYHEEVYLSVIPLQKAFERSIQTAILVSGGSIGFSKRTPAESMPILRPTVAALTGTQIQHFLTDITTKAYSNVLTRAFCNFGLYVAQQAESYDISTPWIVEEIVIKRFREQVGLRLRLLLSTSNLLPGQVQSLLRTALHIPVIQVYGTSETCGIISMQHIKDKATDRIGAPSVACEVKITGKNSLMVKGLNVSKEAVDSDNYFDTGKRVEVCWDGLELL